MPQKMRRFHPRPISDWPAYWFLLLDSYLAQGELEAAAEAKRQLDRLGVEVRYHVNRKAALLERSRRTPGATS